MEVEMLKFKSIDSIKEASMMEKFLSVFLGVMISLLTVVIIGIAKL